MDIYTSQLKYSGPDRLDITVKGQDPVGKHFAPTWEMVMGIQNKTISKELYTYAYTGMMLCSRYISAPKVWEQIRNLDRITLVCFCPASAFCHRVLLANTFQNMGWGEYKGEIL